MRIALCAIVLLLTSGAALADQLILTDGTTLEGTVIKQSDGYWIKLPDGSTRTLAASEVKSHVRGSGAAGGSADFVSTKRRADAVEAPLAAVAIWQKYLDSGGAETRLAQAELDRWKKLAEEGAEKVGGKWISGEQRKEMIQRANTLIDEAVREFRANQTLAAVKKLEEARRVYPNDERPYFFLGYINLNPNPEQAIRNFEQGLRIRPDSVEGLNNLGIALIVRKEVVRGLEYIYKAAQKQDSKELAQNLLNAAALVPEKQKDTASVKEAIEASRLLAAKYNLHGPTPSFNFMPPGAQPRRSESELPPGALSSGTGFIIRDDGLILTNRHVVEGNHELLVILPGNVRKSRAGRQD